ncbi:hypothetical protein [Halorientalis regularis]|uniref:Uncharacterized protein n=1 Tax=Halorientalis regularis TaxID=660518 RepID=A0A1G7SKV0_9EURY|nr:hypothetical protein [Halorientalis regularis]SDG23522.1 hypothetical protein SAMN05216218_11910 [Halorientalis regularis]
MSENAETDRFAGTYYVLINTEPIGTKADQPFLPVNKLILVDESFDPDDVPESFSPEPSSEDAIFYDRETAETHRDAYHAAGEEHIELREVTLAPVE